MSSDKRKGTARKMHLPVVIAVFSISPSSSSFFFLSFFFFFFFTNSQRRVSLIHAIGNHLLLYLLMNRHGL